MTNQQQTILYYQWSSFGRAQLSSAFVVYDDGIPLDFITSLLKHLMVVENDSKNMVIF
jgi:hypothetical protein